MERTADDPADDSDGKKNVVEGSIHGTVYLKRQIGLISATSIVVGSMIGSGIFISPKGILENTNSVGMSIVIWAVCGVISMGGALCYAELGTMIPKSGGEFSYFLEMYGSLIAFGYSWLANLVLKPSTAIIILTCADYIVYPIYDGTACGPPTVVTKLVAVCIAVFLVAVNCISVRLSALITNVFTFVKLIALVIIVIVGVIEIGKGNTYYINPKRSFSGSSSSVAAYALACYQGLWSYEGWNGLNNITEELTNYKRNLPLAIIIGVPLVTGVYVSTNIAYFTVLSPEQLLLSDAVAFTFAKQTLGAYSWIITLSVVCSTFGAANANLFPSGRISYAAAREGHMPQILSMVHVTRITPLPAVLFLGSMIIILIIPGDINTLINYFSFAQWMVYALAIFGVILMRYRHPDWKRPIKVPLVIPVFMVVVSCYLVVAPVVEDPSVEFLYAGLFVVAGLLLYFPIMQFKWIPISLIDKITIFLQRLLQVVPSSYSDAKEW